MKLSLRLGHGLWYSAHCYPSILGSNRTYSPDQDKEKPVFGSCPVSFFLPFYSEDLNLKWLWAITDLKRSVTAGVRNDGACSSLLPVAVIKSFNQKYLWGGMGLFRPTVLGNNVSPRELEAETTGGWYYWLAHRALLSPPVQGWCWLTSRAT